MKRFVVLLSLCVLCAGCGPSAQGGPQQSESVGELSVSSEIQPGAGEGVSGEGNISEEVVFEESYEDAPEESERVVYEEQGGAAGLTAASEPAASSTPERSAASPAAENAMPVSPAAEQAASSSASPGADINTESSRIQSRSDAAVGADDLAAVEREVIRLINAERATKGLSQLQTDANLTKAARIRSEELYRNDHFAHTRPSGEAWQTVLQTEVPVSYATAGENLAMVEHNMPDYDPAYDASYWYTTWEHSPSHYENMVKPGFTHVGVGITRHIKNGLIVAHATTLFIS